MSSSKIYYFLSIFFLALGGRVVWADETVINNGLNSLESNSMLDSFIGNYMGVEQLSSYLISLIVAIALAIIIAFHPQTYGKRKSLSDIEAPKTLIFYAMIGSLVGATVADYGPQLGFIFFGLGGLMRFRTNSGSSTQTGRLILVALIGLCCGLKMLYIAAISTVVAWILIYILERKTLHHLKIKKIDATVFPEAIEAYRQALKKQNCRIIIEEKNLTKSKVDFIFNSPSQLYREEIAAFLEQHIAAKYQGEIDWDS
ncbi:MAG: MgtC/SapB family protein [Cyanobacteria bacterium J06648_1]